MRLGQRREKPIELCQRPSWADLVWIKSAGRCWYCGVKLKKHAPPRSYNRHRFHVDHLIPLSGGGSGDLPNLVPACSHCNLGKCARSLDEFRHICIRHRVGPVKSTIPRTRVYWFEEMGLS